MSPKIYRLFNWFFITVMLLVITPFSALAAPPQETGDCLEEYTVQADDWLSKIAAKFLGDSQAYPAIVAATNQQHSQNNAFPQITNPDLIETGWKVCIPAAAQAQTLLSNPEANSSAVTIVDALGREITFDQLPQRIVITGRATPMIVNAFYLFPEARQVLAGVNLTDQLTNEFLTLVDPAFAEKALLDYSAGPEQIAPLKPDVILLKSFMADKLGAPLEQLGLQVVYLDLETPEQYNRDLTILGQLLGNPARAEELIGYYQQNVDRVAVAMSDLTADQKPHVLSLQYSDKGGDVAFYVAPASWLQTTMTEMAGGIPVWAEAAEQGGWTIVGFEQIAAWNPDQIYVIAYRSDPEALVDQLKADPKWQELKAVQNNQIFAFAKDYYSWDQPDPRWGLGLLWLSGKIQPERAADINIEQEITNFYTALYGLDEAAVQTNVMPLLKGQP
jgi:iron complex transport system substrate-binding protein